MPISRKRRKKGKKVKHNMHKRDQRLESAMADQPSGVTFQDLINVLAYQEYVKDGTIVAKDAKVHIPEELPVTVSDEDGNKQRVGTATPLPDGHVSIKVDQEFEHLVTFDGDKPNFSIDPAEENEDGR